MSYDEYLMLLDYAEKKLRDTAIDTFYDDNDWMDILVAWLIGLSTNDTLSAMAESAVIDGGAGDDTIQGSNGDDLLLGGSGADRLLGGNGFDTAVYSKARAAVVVNLENPSNNTGDAAGDVYTSIESVIGSFFNDVISGNAAANSLLGNYGDDVLEGGAGGDALGGGAGYDFASYSTANIGVVVNLSDPTKNTGHANGDVYEGIEGVHGSAFGDTISGSEIGNNLYGHEGSDSLSGLDGADYLNGGGGDDTLIGGIGADALEGGWNGFDTASYRTAAAGVAASLMNASFNTGEAQGDNYVSIEALDGSAFNDALTGNNANNVLGGREGDDVLHGHGGTDTLYGGDGGDNLVGGLGADALDGGAGFDYAGYFTASAG
ncbi:calcium-binding protein, partial [Microvirga arabica]